MPGSAAIGWPARLLGLCLGVILLSWPGTGSATPEFSDAWAVFRAAAVTDEGPGAGDTTKLLAARNQAGLSKLEVEAWALVHWAEQAMDSGAFARAGRLLDAAVTVAPDAPEGYLGRSSLALRQGNVFGALSHFVEAVPVMLGHFWIGLGWLAYGALVLWLGAVTTLVALLLPCIWRGARTLQHLFHESTRFSAPRWFVGAAVLALFTLPLVAGMGWGGFILWAAFLGALGGEAKGRRALIALGAVAVLGIWVCAPLVAFSAGQDGLAALVVASSRGATTPISAAGTQAIEGSADTNWRASFAMGLMALERERYDDANSWFERAATQGGPVARIRHNQGVALAREGHFEEAERLFGKLAAAPEASAMTLFDLGQMQSQRLDFAAARASFDAARKKDPDLYLETVRVGTGNRAFYVLPLGFSRGDGQALLLSGIGHSGAMVSALWRGAFGGIPPGMFPVVIGLFAAALWLGPRLLVERRLYACDGCQRAMCHGCLLFVGDMHVCGTCNRWMEEHGGSRMPATRRRRRGNPLRTAGRFVPGLGYAIYARYGWASVHLLIFSAVLWAALLLGTLPQWMLGIPMEGWGVARGLLAALLVAQVAWTALYPASPLAKSVPAGPVEAEMPEPVFKTGTDA